jgi:hypothetical protein
MAGATQKEIAALLKEPGLPEFMPGVRLSNLALIALQVLPVGWLSPMQRHWRKAARELVNYQKLMREVFISMSLTHKKRRGGEGSTNWVHEHVTFGYVQMLYRQTNRGTKENTYRWRLDAYPVGVRASRFLEPQLQKNLRLALGCPVRVVDDGTSVWIVANPVDDQGRPQEAQGELPKMVAMKAMTPPGEKGYWLPIGVDSQGSEVWHNLGAEGFPHLLVGGATGSGKSNILNCWLVSLCSRHTPEELRLWLVDLKRVELADYVSLPHCIRVAKEEGDVAPLLDALQAEMERRYKVLEEQHARHIDKLPAPPPHLLLVVDELAAVTLGVEGKENILRLERLAQLGRSAGIHLILATQRPSVDVCPGSLKANLPARVGLAMATMADSRVILDQNGAEELAPPGQAILVRGVETIRVMTPYLPDDERAKRLGALRVGEIELTNAEKVVLEAAKALMAEGKRPAVRAVYEVTGGNYGRTAAILKRLRQFGLIVDPTEVAEEDGNA